MNRGSVIYLKTGIEQLLKRTANDSKRPLLQTDDPEAQLKILLAEREPFYEEVADLIIESDHRTVNNIVDDICSHQEIL